MAQSTSSTGNQPLIELRHVDKHYGDLHVLNDINLSVDRGEVVVVIGPSGSGKSTMCRTINRLETIDSGEILIEGEPLPQEGKDLARMRAELGMVFQQFNLFAHMTVLQNVMLGPVDVLGVSKDEARERAMDLLSRVRRAGHGVSAVQPVRTYDRTAERHAGTGRCAGRVQGGSS